MLYVAVFVGGIYVVVVVHDDDDDEHENGESGSFDDIGDADDGEDMTLDSGSILKLFLDDAVSEKFDKGSGLLGSSLIFVQSPTFTEWLITSTPLVIDDLIVSGSGGIIASGSFLSADSIAFVAEDESLIDGSSSPLMAGLFKLVIRFKMACSRLLGFSTAGISLSKALSSASLMMAENFFFISLIN